MGKFGKSLIIAGVFLLMIFVPPFLGSYYKRILTEILIWGLFALAFDIIYGYTGMLSFGQALFFGVGSYTVAIAIIHLNPGIWIAILLALAMAILFSAFVGFFSIRVSGAYFVIITFIFGLVFFFISLDWKSVTGGEHGLSIPTPALFSFTPNLTFANSLINYYFVLMFVIPSYFLCRRFLNSPVGKVFQLIKENEDRARLIGYNTARYKLISFVIAGTFSGLSGALYALTSRYTSVEFLYWTVSGEAVVWTVIGGAGTLIGPMVGAGILILFTDYISSWFRNFPILVGIILITVVIISPQGIVGIIKERIKGVKFLGRQP
ncbi:MAG: branched-chain amino acid ABC transporter permease [Thermodesulfobacteriota bacterium]|nr:branched-chain amino acid ABC transporter permease [Thermodesulfobacteriota bacterium]